MTVTTAAPQRSPSSAARDGRPGGGTATSEAVLAALAGSPGTTAEEVAVATGLGRSTVTKALAALGADHRVARSPGGRERGRRLADRWSLPQPALTTADQLQLARTDRSAVLPDGDRGVEGHLGRGQLRALVAAHLAAEPEVEFTPSRLGSLLGRSAGAIGNALARMVEDGLAVQTTAGPRRYRHAQTGEPR
jgi:DNA-binding MarR family transcriptional regulator